MEVVISEANASICLKNKGLRVPLTNLNSHQGLGRLCIEVDPLKNVFFSLKLKFTLIFGSQTRLRWVKSWLQLIFA